MAEIRINIHSYPNCCGIYILSYFFRGPGGAQLLETDTQWKARIKRQLEEKIESLRMKKTYLLATLNEWEYSVLGQTFLDVGFEIAFPMRKNPTGSRIIVYGYSLCKKKADKPLKSILKRVK